MNYMKHWRILAMAGALIFFAVIAVYFLNPDQELPQPVVPSLLVVPVESKIIILVLADGKALAGCDVFLGNLRLQTDQAGSAVFSGTEFALNQQVIVRHEIWGEQLGTVVDQKASIHFTSNCSLEVRLELFGTSVVEAFLLNPENEKIPIDFVEREGGRGEHYTNINALSPGKYKFQCKTFAGEIQGAIEFLRNGERIVRTYRKDDIAEKSYKYILEVTDSAGRPSAFYGLGIFLMRSGVRVTMHIELDAKGRKKLDSRFPVDGASLTLKSLEFGEHKFEPLEVVDGIVTVRFPQVQHQIEVVLKGGSPASNIEVDLNGVRRKLDAKGRVLSYETETIASLEIPCLEYQPLGIDPTLEWLPLQFSIQEKVTLIRLEGNTYQLGPTFSKRGLVRLIFTGGAIGFCLPEGGLLAKEFSFTPFLVRSDTKARFLFSCNNRRTRIMWIGDELDWKRGRAAKVGEFYRHQTQIGRVWTILDHRNFWLSANGKPRGGSNKITFREGLTRNTVKAWSAGEYRVSLPVTHHYWIVTPDGGALRIDSTFKGGESVVIPDANFIRGQVDKKEAVIVLAGPHESFRCRVSSDTGFFCFPELPAGPLTLSIEGELSENTIAVDPSIREYDLRQGQ